MARVGISGIHHCLCYAWRILSKPHIPFGVVVHAAGPRHTSTCRLDLLPVGCWVHPLLGSGEPWQSRASSSGV